jgi:Ni/Co efflux regulator RcnB
MMHRTHTKVITGVILAALIATTMAPAAEAGRRKNKERSKHVYSQRDSRPHRGVRYVQPKRHRASNHYYYRHRGDHSGLAFLGGLVLGAVITNSAHADHHSYYYADPYCDVRFSSLDAYHGHLRYNHHPRIVHVVDVRSGDWVDSYTWHRSGWRHYETDRWECEWDG